jgi:membrane protease YdiL (CAAX protease family)
MLPAWLVQRVPRDHRERDHVSRRRRRVVAGTAVAGAGLLGLSLSTEPGSTEFYGLTLGVAATWIAGGLASGPLQLGHTRRGGTRPVLTPILLGAGAFGLFYGCALVSRRIPVLNGAIATILRYSDKGAQSLVLCAALANGVAEEVFFRGALYTAAGERHPVVSSTAVYALATAATRNPALVLASGVMGTLFGLQRRASGGIQAPMLTHLVWSTLMLRYLPPLFRKPTTW